MICAIRIINSVSSTIYPCEKEATVNKYPMDEDAASNARVQTFFQRDPIEFIDDVVMAMSHYVQSGIESLGSVMVNVRLSDNHKRAFMRELTARVMHSLNVNSDIFEMYVMRNIFHIPVDVDFAGSLAQSQDSSAEALDGSFKPAPESDDFDKEILRLRAKIRESNEKRKRLLHSVKENEAKLQISKAALDRMPEILEEAQATADLPCDQINRLIQSMRNLLRKSKAIEVGDAMQSLAFHEAAFSFD
jgi:hypothetical protein